MTYQRISAEKYSADGISANAERKNTDESQTAIKEIEANGAFAEPNEGEYHRPEIVFAKRDISERTNTKKPFSAGRILAAAALCFASFILGCSVTDDKVSEIIIKIAAASLGNLQESSAEELYSVQSYRKGLFPPADGGAEAENAVGNPETTLSDGEYTYISSENSAGYIPQEVETGSEAYGRVGADGEILYTVTGEDMSCADVTSLSNQTSKKPDTEYLLGKTPSALENLEINPEEPLVLIIHTHGTECYNSYPGGGYTSDKIPVRCSDTAENVVSIGTKIAGILNDFGIPTVHSEKMCDSESFVRAYSVSAQEAKSWLERYPSIKFVIDLHRDAIELADGRRKKPVFEAFGESTAQLMFVVGTDEAGANHPNWEENLSLALNVQNEIAEDVPGLFRRINLRSASFNQQISPGYMLLECGAAANTKEEAENAAEIFATGLARVIKNART